ncbi:MULTISPECIES: 4a-hydroxytetrahydrobiopterin dehydratase [Acidianus]|uniref:Putative pterin-4-alpha-carbinolamine dehydratase n=1 Tax=Candidatus Acidianus copahuensis TaxID=1160895 RepID=A0A031LV34_9CREN|nr:MULTISPECIES: 4a-hydroxytetrahydrobiopterin dehydratase [Acidianus]EZQ11003.1 pterin-4-alpha-carbinolamine dehydratase [Candidatus Acidianus copahuensis]NON63227.1 4a-hydroxytetrahydrobiopterin dehydratase [Acidianus sp. RZ1]
MTKLSEQEIRKEISNLQGWTYEENKIKKEFQFTNFDDSVTFVWMIRPIANGMNHHPDLCIYYNKVIVELTTHDEGGVTDLDLQLAEKIDDISKHVRS